MDKNKKFAVLAVAIIFLLLVVVIFQFITLASEVQKQATLEADIADMEAKIASMTEEISYRETLLYIEKYARENLELFGEDDIIFVPNE